MYDSILYYSQIAQRKSAILKDLDFLFPKTRNSKLVTRNYYLATLHRAENTDDPKRLRSIFTALREISQEWPVILPLHPRTKKMMRVQGLIKEARGIQLIDPVSYLDMLRLEKHARVILTDSGGVQKEAYWFRVPCITLREETEWLETIRSGWNVLVGTASDSIVKETKRQNRRTFPASKTKIFGDGKASEKIVQALFDYFLR
jgi:UDP-GlcNAc3NAcA epimerase